MKHLILITALVAASPVVAQQTVTAKVEDRYTIVTVSEPYTTKECAMVDVPVYGNVTTKGDAAGGALLGMIVGGILGKAASGNSDGAAAGAVMGGVIGADKGAKNKTSRQIIGYRNERQCSNVTLYKDERKRVYDYSTITWKIDGVIYSENFRK